MSVDTVPKINIKFNSGNPELDKQLYQNFAILRRLLSAGQGISGTFTTVDLKTITVLNGIIVSIV